MPIYAERQVLLAKKETTYGTDAVPTGAEAMLAYDLAPTPPAISYASRRPATPWFRGAEQVVANKHQPLVFGIEAAGSGTAGTAPAYKELMKAAGLAEVVTPGVKTEYSPASPPYDSASVYFHVDGERRRSLGTRFGLAFEAEAGNVPMFRFTGMGLYTARSAQAMPAPNWAAFRNGIAVNMANTPTFTLFGTACVLRRLAVEFGQKAFYHNLVGAEEVRLTGREPSGSVLVEAPALATKDLIDAAVAEETGALQLIHGTVAGNIVQLDLVKVKLTNPREQVVDGTLCQEFDLNILPSAGDDDFKITVK